jgi:hypothetical protein
VGGRSGPGAVGGVRAGHGQWPVTAGQGARRRVAVAAWTEVWGERGWRESGGGVCVRERVCGRDACTKIFEAF